MIALFSSTRCSWLLLQRVDKCWLKSKFDMRIVGFRCGVPLESVSPYIHWSMMVNRRRKRIRIATTIDNRQIMLSLGCSRMIRPPRSMMSAKTVKVNRSKTMPSWRETRDFSGLTTELKWLQGPNGSQRGLDMTTSGVLPLISFMHLDRSHCRRKS